MAHWEVNKGVGRPVEFKGLKAQYLFILAGGLLLLFIVAAVCYMAGLDQRICISACAAGALALLWGVFRLNAKYGEHGLMKMAAASRHPVYLKNDTPLRRIIKHKRQ